MTSQYRHRRTSIPSTPFPTVIEPGEIAVNTANRQLAVGDAESSQVGKPLPLIAIRFFDSRAQYANNDFVIQAGSIYRATAPITPGSFNAANWTLLAEPGTFVLKTGDSMSGFLTLHASPTDNMHAATKVYVDSKAAVYTSDTPPLGALDNSLWFESDTGMLYIRYFDGDSSQWTIASPQPDFSILAVDANVVHKAGDTMTGDLTISKATPQINLNKTGAQDLNLAGKMNGAYRWSINLGNAVAETGSNVGSDFGIARFSDAGTFLDNPFQIQRSNGLVTLVADPIAALGVATKQYVDARISTIRLQKFVASGTYTPHAKMLVAIIEAQAAGGGGSSATANATSSVAGGGGGAGSYSCSIALRAAVGASQVVTIGAAGTAGAVGGNTSVGGLCTTNGGQAGLYAQINIQVPQGGLGGAAGVGDIAVPGQNGWSGMYASPAVFYMGGEGGNSRYGAGGKATANSGSGVNGNPATGYGSGGGGGSSIATTGGATGSAGAPGIVVITEFCSS